MKVTEYYYRSYETATAQQMLKLLFLHERLDWVPGKFLSKPLMPHQGFKRNFPAGGSEAYTNTPTDPRQRYSRQTA